MAGSKLYKNVYLYLALGLVVVFWGFSGSYFSRLGQMGLPYHIHGISATLWMILMIVQPYLYRVNRLKLHRYLGWTSLVLVLVILYGGLEMMKLMIQNQENFPPNTVYQLAFIDVATLLGFVGLYLLAIYFRKRLPLHARFMVCTIFGPLNPALTRVFFSLGWADSFHISLTYSYLLLELVILVIIWGERSTKEMKYTYLPVLLFTIVQHVLMYYAGNWNWWVNAMNGLADYH